MRGNETTNAKGNEMKATQTRESRIDEIKTTIEKLEVGYCGVRWDCVVWRLSKTLWQVGDDSVSVNNEPLTTEEAARFIEMS